MFFFVQNPDVDANSCAVAIDGYLKPAWRMVHRSCSPLGKSRAPQCCPLVIRKWL